MIICNMIICSDDLRAGPLGGTFCATQSFERGPTFLTIGNFDGIHLGHQALLRGLQTEAAAHSPPAKTALLTFDPHPLAILRPHVPLQLLTTPDERLQLLAPFGLDLGIIQPFDQALARLTPAQFMRLLVERLGLVRLVVGPDFALGRGRAGTVAVLQALGTEMGYGVSVVELVAGTSGEVRSHQIRQLLRAGNVRDAWQMLGRPYRVMGIVEEGERRGRTIGVPTANIRPLPQRLLPADGVYATWAYLQDDKHNDNQDDKQGNTAGLARASVTNIGIRPTVDGRQHRVETHLLDFPGPGEPSQLYGQQLAVAFVSRLRAEQRFDSLAELLAQIRRDILATRSVLQPMPRNCR